MPTKTMNRRWLSVPLDESLHEAIRRLAFEQNISRASWARRALIAAATPSRTPPPAPPSAGESR